MKNPPQLSAILVVPYGYREILITLQHLAAQRLVDQIQMVFVLSPGGADEPLPPACKAFHSVLTVVEGPLETTGASWAAGIRRAEADLIVLCEDHCFPQPGWADALLQAARPDRLVIVPRVVNANPDSPVSWVSFLLNYGQCTRQDVAGPAPAVTPHQGMYCRQALLDLGDDLDLLLNTEALLHERWRAQGRILYLEPAARTVHYNVEFWLSLAREQMWGARLFAARRSARWSAARKLLYSFGFPLIMAVRYRRTRQLLALPIIPPAVAGRARLALLWGLAAATLGEVTGYLLGAGRSNELRFQTEFRRHLHLRNGYKETLDAHGR